MSRFRHVIAGMAAAVILAVSPAIGSDNEHAHEAEYHAEEAVKHAGMGHPKMVAKEAEKGLAFAKKAVETDNANEVLKKVVIELESAVKQGQNGDVDAAGKHAKAALEHLKKVNN